MSTTAGIDIGSEAIKGVVLKAEKTGPVEVIGAGTMPIADLTRMPESPDRALAIGEKLRELVRSARLRAETRRVGASGGRTSIRYLQIPPVPPWRLEMLVKYEVEERAEEKEANCSDYHIMDVPESNGQYTVIIGMCRESYATELLGQAKSGGLGEIEIDLEALALYSAYYHGHGFDADKTVAVADIGADDLTVLICKNGALYYARTLLGGGRRFTQNLADDLKLEWSEADDLKKTTAEIVFDAPPAAGSSTARPRMQRTGATLSLPRSSMPGKPGASNVIPGIQAPDAAGSSGVNPSGAPARSGIVPVPGAGAVAPAGGSEESRRARVSDGAKMNVRPSPTPGNPAGSQIKPAVPPAAPSGQSPAGGPQPAPGPASSAVAPNPAQSQKLPAAMVMIPSDYSAPSLEELELDTTPSAPLKVVRAPAVSAASAALVPVAPKPVPAPAPGALDDFELQPIDDEKKDAPNSAGPKPSPLTATQYAAPPVPQGNIDLMPVNDSAKSAPENGAVTGVASQDMADLSASSSGTPALNDDKDRRKRQTTAALVREAAVLCAAVENVMLNAKQQAKQPQMKLDRLYITGGGSKLKGLPEFMGRRLRVEVQMLEPLRNLSLARLSPAAAEALRGEQHTLGVALGLALSDLRKGSFNFQLLPQSIKNRREFWARGAYHYYAAGAAALALGLLVYTPYKNTDALNENFTRANDAFTLARTQNDGVKKQEKENNELRHRLKTITDNVQSGDYFLNLLAELKSKQRIQDDIYLSSISTTMPAVVMAEATTSEGGKPPEANKEPDSFLAQRRVYLRGFARGKQKESLIKPIQDFYDKLVPFPLDPDNPANLFKDIRPIWISKEDNLMGGLYLKEFVLEAYTAAAAKDATAKTETTNPKTLGDKKNIKKDVPKTPVGKPIVPVNPPAVLPANPRANPFVPQAPVTPPLVPAIRQNQPQPGPVEQPIQDVQPARPAAQPINPGIPARPVPAVPVPVRPLIPAIPNNQPAVPEPKRKPVYVVPDEPAVAPEKVLKGAKQ